MSTDKKTVYRGFGYLRCDDFAAYLEEMAARGWHLESWGAGLHFSRGEPEQAVYAVEVFTDASDYNTRPEMNTKEFAEYCEAAGWHLVDAKGKICIFKKLRPDAHPIMTDQERLEAVAAEERKKVLRNLAVSGIWCLTRWGDFLGSGFVRRIFLYPSLLLLATWTALFLAALGSFVHLLIWKAKAQKRIGDGQMLWLGRGGGFQNRAYDVVLWLVMPLWLGSLVLLGEYWMGLLTLIVLGVLWLMGYLIAKKRPDAVTNQIIQVLVSMGMVLALFIFAFGTMFAEEEPENPADFPLYMEDLGVEGMIADDLYLEDWSTVFGSVRQYTVYYGRDMLMYTVYESDLEWVLDKIWKEVTDADNWEQGDALDWDAESVVTRFGNSYVARWADRILLFNGVGEEPLTPEQIAAVRAALCP